MRAGRRLSDRLLTLIPPFRKQSLYANPRAYWDARYSSGGTSGAGSYGAVAEYKAGFLNNLVFQSRVRSVLEFGCGDGHQLSLAQYDRYIGLDVSRQAIDLCSRRFADDDTKSFMFYDPRAFVNHGALVAELTLSLDVLYHLVEDEWFELHMRHLFEASERLVAIFAPDVDQRVADHVRYRSFTPWIAEHQPGWALVNHERNTLAEAGHDTAAEFFVYSRATSS